MSCPVESVTLTALRMLGAMTIEKFTYGQVIGRNSVDHTYEALILALVSIEVLLSAMT